MDIELKNFLKHNQSYLCTTYINFLEFIKYDFTCVNAKTLIEFAICEWDENTNKANYIDAHRDDISETIHQYGWEKCSNADKFFTHYYVLNTVAEIYQSLPFIVTTEYYQSLLINSYINEHLTIKDREKIENNCNGFIKSVINQINLAEIYYNIPSID